MTTTAVKERPILCSAHEVRAILEGRKTQMRRVVKPQYPEFVGKTLTHWEFLEPGTRHFLPFPYGNPGDRLWVKESVLVRNPANAGLKLGKNRGWLWPKLNETDGKRWFSAHCIYGTETDIGCQWDPLNKMFMPRWASRITLEITGVRVERLQEISEEDAKAEGVVLPYGVDPNKTTGWRDSMKYRLSFQHLWEPINGKGSWDKNPWVWVLEFKRMEARDGS